jgi:hypothetical protein
MYEDKLAQGDDRTGAGYEAILCVNTTLLYLVSFVVFLFLLPEQLDCLVHGLLRRNYGDVNAFQQQHLPI